MSLNAASAIADGRRFAESLMQDTATIRRQNGTTRNPETGYDVPNFDTIHTGKCKVQLKTIAASSAQEIGGAVVTQTTRRVDLPLSAPEVEPDDLIDITASRDPQLVGKTFRVTSRFAKTFATARRLEVKEP